MAMPSTSEGKSDQSVSDGVHLFHPGQFPGHCQANFYACSVNAFSIRKMAWGSGKHPRNQAFMVLC